MQKTTFEVPKMDCPSEENQISNSLVMDFNLNLVFETLKRKIC